MSGLRVRTPGELGNHLAKLYYLAIGEGQSAERIAQGGKQEGQKAESREQHGAERKTRGTVGRAQRAVSSKNSVKC